MFFDFSLPQAIKYRLYFPMKGKLRCPSGLARQGENRRDRLHLLQRGHSRAVFSRGSRLLGLESLGGLKNKALNMLSQSR